MNQETMNALLDQKPALTVASATVVSALASRYDILEGWLSLIALAVGILLSLAIFAKTIILTIKAYKEMRIMEEREHRRRKEDADE